jgi:hypothetical protein
MSRTDDYIERHSHLPRSAKATPRTVTATTRLRKALSKHGWYIARVDNTAWVESSEWVPVLAALTPSDPLDVAWAEAEAALSERHGPLVVQSRGDWGATVDYTAWTYDPQMPTVEGHGPTPTAALRALAARLSSKADPEEPHG